MQHAAGQVAALFQAAIAVAWAMLLLWLWTRWRGIALFAQGASLLPRSGAGAVYRAMGLPVSRRRPLRAVAVAFLFGLIAVLMRAAAQGRWRSRLGFAAGVALLAVWAWATGQGGVGLLTLAAALAFVLGLHQVRCAQMQRQDLMRWRFYQHSVWPLVAAIGGGGVQPELELSAGLERAGRDVAAGGMRRTGVSVSAGCGCRAGMKRRVTRA